MKSFCGWCRQVLSLRWLQHNWVRFLLVGGFGELLYLGLYGLIWRASGQTMLAIAVAGGICMVINAVLHARISFRVRFHGRLLVSYLLIQGFCLGLSLIAGRVLEQIGASPLAVGLLTLVLWSGTSFLLTRRSFRPQPQPPAEAGCLGPLSDAGVVARQPRREP